MLEKAWRINKKMKTYLHQWILQGNGEITLELEREWVFLSPKEIVLNRKESPKVELSEFILR